MKNTTFLSFIIVLVLSIFSCENSSSRKIQAVPEQSLKPKLISKSEAFKTEKGENWNQNNSIEAKTNSEYRDSLTVWIQEPSILDDLEFKFKEIQEGQKDGNKVQAAVFWLNSHMSNMIIGGEISEEMVSQLKTDHVYKIKGTYMGEIVHLPIKIEENNKYSLGSHRFKISELKEIENPKAAFY